MVGKQKALEITPFEDKETLMQALCRRLNMFPLSK
jgi:hypothetical protein